ncbi:unnamed protein product, partial [Ascophyllum nodosum]
SCKLRVQIRTASRKAVAATIRTLGGAPYSSTAVLVQQTVQQYTTLHTYVHCTEEAHAAFSLKGMSLPLETLRELGKLSDFRKRGVILEQHFEVIKKHVRGGNCLANGDWEAIDLAWKLKGRASFRNKSGPQRLMDNFMPSSALALRFQRSQRPPHPLHHHLHQHRYLGRRQHDQRLLQR